MTFINPTMSKTRRRVAVRSTRWLEISPHPGLRITTRQSIPDTIFAERLDTMPAERPAVSWRQPWRVNPARSFGTLHLKTRRIDGSAELRASPRALSNPESLFMTAAPIINRLRRFNGVMRLSLTTRVSDSHRPRAQALFDDVHKSNHVKNETAGGCSLHSLVRDKSAPRAQDNHSSIHP